MRWLIRIKILQPHMLRRCRNGVQGRFGGAQTLFRVFTKE